MIKEKESKQERFQETRNPNKKDSDKRSTNIRSADRWSI